MNNDSNLSILLSAKNNASAVIKQAQADVNTMAKETSAATDRTSGRFAAAGTIIKGALIGASVAAIGAGAASISMANDFNGSMANVASLIPGNTQRVIELKKSVQDMSIVTGKSTADLSNGLYQVVSAFGDTADTAKIVEVNAKAAAAGLATTTDAINLTSAVTKGYGDTSAKAVQTASDLALTTVKLGQTTFPELAASIGRVTPLAAGLNVTQQELFGTMATFTGVTGGAAEVSTQLRGVLQAMMAPTDSMSKLMKKLGYENGAAMLKGEGLQKTIALVTDEAKKTGAPLQDYIGSIEGQTLAMAASGGQADTFKQKIAAMGDVAGATDTAFGEQTQGINKTGFAMAQAKQQLEVLGQRFGDKLLPMVSAAATTALDFAKVLTDNLGPAFQWMADHGAAAAIAVGSIGGAFVAIRTAGAISDFATTIKKSKDLLTVFVGAKNANGIRAVGSAFKFAGKQALSFALSPIGLIVIGIAAVAAAAYLIIQNWDIIKSVSIDVWDSVSAAVTGFVNGALALAQGALESVAKWFEANKTAILSVAGVLTAIFGPALLKVGTQAVIAAGKVILAAIRSGAAWAKNAIIATAEWVKSVPAMIKAAATNGASNVKQAAISGAAWVKNAAISGAAWAKQSAKMVVKTVWAGVLMAAQASKVGWQWVAAGVKLVAYNTAMIAVKVATGLWTAAQWALNVALNANPISLIIIAVLALIAGIVLLYQNSETFRNIVTGAFNAVWGAIQAVWNWISSNWPLLLAILTGPIGLAVLWIINNWDTVKAAFAAAWEFIKAVWGNVIGWFGAVWQGIVAIFNGVGGWFAGIFNGAWNGIKNAFSSVAGFFRGIWDGIVSIFGKVGTSIGDAIGSAFKTTVNGVLGFIEGFVNGAIDLINGLIGGIDKIIPGDQSGWKLGKISLPRLAKGGIIMPQPGGVMANIAEAGKPEAVIPLDKLSSMINGGGKGGGDTYKIDVHVTVQNDGTDFTDAQAVGMAQKIGRALRSQGLKIDSMGALR